MRASIALSKATGLFRVDILDILTVNTENARDTE